MKGLLRFLIILVVGALMCGLPIYLLPALQVPVAFPHVEIAAEALTAEPLFHVAGQPFYLTNTMIATLLADLVLLALAFVAGNAARKRLKRWQDDRNAVDAQGDDMMVPKGWHNAFEALLEYLYNLVEQVIGHKRVLQVFPLVATIFLFVLVANWLHFVPGVDSVGILHCNEHYKGFDVAELGDSHIYRLDFNHGEISTLGETPKECPEHHDIEPDSEARYIVTPFLRTATTDLNLTVAIAIVAMVSVQIFGVRELGISYFSKFINFPALERGFFGLIFFGAGFIEILSEVAKVISFSLRLFGNLFAGTILLFVMAFLIPIGVPIVFYALEVFVGLIQAFVFATLTMAFIASAMAGHGEDHH